ncbi:hypothetical protein H696_02514 [Fonticula alba]|uniref:Uncharacterized protein n=1 Tax=Fonticula alba TaxID=691883 RepID=A0A058ZB02_FONAL|nr:hypothetical protein H696_02514 [Fonticula alba]KCV71574.1 hypothetical protein H696_02514 [Fonticula alba]|eukprot:XP_009494697.1 hypothetical protein H696_02514 [Fonticula alba]
MLSSNIFRAGQLASAAPMEHARQYARVPLSVSIAQFAEKRLAEKERKLATRNTLIQRTRENIKRDEVSPLQPSGNPNVMDQSYSLEASRMRRKYLVEMHEKRLVREARQLERAKTSPEALERKARRQAEVSVRASKHKALLAQQRVHTATRRAMRLERALEVERSRAAASTMLLRWFAEDFKPITRENIDNVLELAFNHRVSYNTSLPPLQYQVAFVNSVLASGLDTFASTALGYSLRNPGTIRPDLLEYGYSPMKPHARHLAHSATGLERVAQVFDGVMLPTLNRVAALPAGAQAAVVSDILTNMMLAKSPALSSAAMLEPLTGLLARPEFKQLAAGKAPASEAGASATEQSLAPVADSVLFDLFKRPVVLPTDPLSYRPLEFLFNSKYAKVLNQPVASSGQATSAELLRDLLFAHVVHSVEGHPFLHRAPAAISGHLARSLIQRLDQSLVGPALAVHSGQPAASLVSANGAAAFYPRFPEVFRQDGPASFLVQLPSGPADAIVAERVRALTTVITAKRPTASSPLTGAAAELTTAAESLPEHCGMLTGAAAAETGAGLAPRGFRTVPGSLAAFDARFAATSPLVTAGESDEDGPQSASEQSSFTWLAGLTDPGHYSPLFRDHDARDALELTATQRQALQLIISPTSATETPQGQVLDPTAVTPTGGRPSPAMPASLAKLVEAFPLTGALYLEMESLRQAGELVLPEPSRRPAFDPDLTFLHTYEALLASFGDFSNSRAALLLAEEFRQSVSDMIAYVAGLGHLVDIQQNGWAGAAGPVNRTLFTAQPRLGTPFAPFLAFDNASPLEMTRFNPVTDVAPGAAAGTPASGLPSSLALGEGCPFPGAELNFTAPLYLENTALFTHWLRVLAHLAAHAKPTDTFSLAELLPGLPENYPLGGELSSSDRHSVADLFAVNFNQLVADIFAQGLAPTEEFRALLEESSMHPMEVARRLSQANAPTDAATISPFRDTAGLHSVLDFPRLPGSVSASLKEYEADPHVPANQLSNARLMQQFFSLLDRLDYSTADDYADPTFNDTDPLPPPIQRDIDDDMDSDVFGPIIPKMPNGEPMFSAPAGTARRLLTSTGYALDVLTPDSESLPVIPPPDVNPRNFVDRKFPSKEEEELKRATASLSANPAGELDFDHEATSAFFLSSSSSGEDSFASDGASHGSWGVPSGRALKSFSTPGDAPAGASGSRYTGLALFDSSESEADSTWDSVHGSSGINTPTAFESLIGRPAPKASGAMLALLAGCKLDDVETRMRQLNTKASLSGLVQDLIRQMPAGVAADPAARYASFGPLSGLASLQGTSLRSPLLGQAPSTAVLMAGSYRPSAVNFVHDFALAFAQDTASCSIQEFPDFVRNKFLQTAAEDGVEATSADLHPGLINSSVISQVVPFHHLAMPSSLPAGGAYAMSALLGLFPQHFDFVKRFRDSIGDSQATLPGLGPVALGPDGPLLATGSLPEQLRAALMVMTEHPAMASAVAIDAGLRYSALHFVAHSGLLSDPRVSRQISSLVTPQQVLKMVLQRVGAGNVLSLDGMPLTSVEQLEALSARVNEAPSMAALPVSLVDALYGFLAEDILDVLVQHRPFLREEDHRFPGFASATDRRLAYSTAEMFQLHRSLGCPTDEQMSLFSTDAGVEAASAGAAAPSVLHLMQYATHATGLDAAAFPGGLLDPEQLTVALNTANGVTSPDGGLAGSGASADGIVNAPVTKEIPMPEWPATGSPALEASPFLQDFNLALKTSPHNFANLRASLSTYSRTSRFAKAAHEASSLNNLTAAADLFRSHFPTNETAAQEDRILELGLRPTTSVDLIMAPFASTKMLQRSEFDEAESTLFFRMERERQGYACAQTQLAVRRRFIEEVSRRPSSSDTSLPHASDQALFSPEAEAFYSAPAVSALSPEARMLNPRDQNILRALASLGSAHAWSVSNQETASVSADYLRRSSFSTLSAEHEHILQQQVPELMDLLESSNTVDYIREAVTGEVDINPLPFNAMDSSHVPMVESPDHAVLNRFQFAESTDESGGDLDYNRVFRTEGYF